MQNWKILFLKGNFNQKQMNFLNGLDKKKKKNEFSGILGHDEEHTRKYSEFS